MFCIPRLKSPIRAKRLCGVKLKAVFNISSKVFQEILFSEETKFFHETTVTATITLIRAFVKLQTTIFFPTFPFARFTILLPP